MRKTKEQKAITLIALIITVVVLLVLAVVTIRAVQGDGIIQHANDAKAEHIVAQEKEKITLALNQAYLDGKGEIKQDVLKTILEDQFGSDAVCTNENGYVQISIKSSGNKFNVMLNGQIDGPLDGVEETPGGENPGDTPSGGNNENVEYDSIFQFSFDANTKKATITGIKFENIEITKKTESAVVLVEEFSIIDNSGNRISTLEIPSIIKLGDEEYEVERIEEIVNSSYLGGYYVGEAKNTDITELIIPSSIEEISSTRQVFNYFTNLQEVNIEADIIIDQGTFEGTPFVANNGNIFVYKGEIITVNELAQEIVIPSEVTSLPDGMFSGCSSLTKVEGIDRFTDLEVYNSFKGSSIVTINENNGFKTYKTVLVEITSSANSNGEINIPDTVTAIGNGVLMNIGSCGKIIINIPNSVNIIDSRAFVVLGISDTRITAINIAKPQEGSIADTQPWGAGECNYGGSSYDVLINWNWTGSN